MCKKITILLLFMCLLAEGQLPRPSRYEWLWALGHPFAALKVKKISRQCDKIISPSEIFAQLDSMTSGGKADAFRHVFFMSAYSQKIKQKKLRKLGRAHERSNYSQFLKNRDEYGEKPDSLSSVMDLANNEVGIRIGSENKQLPLEGLKLLVITEIRRGKAKIMKRDKRGNYLSCQNQVIDLSLYLKVWVVAKCLVDSDFLPE